MRIRSTLWLVAVGVFALVTVGFNSAAMAQKVTGAIFTTDQCSNFVNGNVYDTAFTMTQSEDCLQGKGNYLTVPYLNGGPRPNAPCDSAGLPDGDYYFQVTDPSGKVLLSLNLSGTEQNLIEERRVTVAGGLIVYDPSNPATFLPAHTSSLTGGKCNDSHPHNIAVQLYPYLRTPNPGGEYKVWMTSTSTGYYVPCDPNYPANCQGSFGFIPSKSKTDNFKVVDYDGDGIPDAEDACPNVYDPTNACGGGDEPDSDGDGVPDNADRCPGLNDFDPIECPDVG